MNNTKGKTILTTLVLTALAGGAMAATGAGSTVLGAQNEVPGTTSLVAGVRNKVGASDSLVVGTVNKIDGDMSIAAGHNNLINARAQNSLVIGSENQANAQSVLVTGWGNYANGNYSFVGGSNSQTRGSNSIAFGSNAQTNYDDTYAIGRKAVTSAANTLAVGNQANASGEGALAIGFNSEASARDSIAIGGNVREPGDTITGEPKTTASGRQSIAIGYRATTKGSLGISIGDNAYSEGNSSVAIGGWSIASGSNATAVGGGHARADRAVVVGSGNADGVESVSMGYYSRVYAEGAIGIGRNVFIDENATDSVVIGSSSNEITKKNVTAIGANTSSEVENSVALGTLSRADEVVSTSSANIAGKTYNFAGETANGTVSIGGKILTGYKTDEHGFPITDDNGNTIPEFGETTYRTITNVAAGRVSTTSTDAVNGSQLNAVVDAVNKNADAITNLNDNAVVQGGENIHIATVNGNQRGVSLARNLQHMESAHFGFEDEEDGTFITKKGIDVANNDSNTNVSAGAVRTFAGSENTGMTAKGIVIENTDTLEQASFTSGGMQASDDNATIRFTTTDVNVGNQQVHGVKAGVADTDAVNVKQLKDSITAATSNLVDHDTITTVTAGTNTTVTNDGNHNYTVSVNKDLNDLNSTNYGKVTDYKHTAVTKDGLIAFNGDVDTKHNANGMIIENRNTLDVASYNINGMTASDANGNVRFTTTDINAGDQQIHGVKAGTAGMDVVNVNQMNKAIADNATVVQAGDNVKVHKDYNTYTVSIGKDLTGLNSVGLNDGNNESSYTTEGVNITYRGAGNGAEYHTSYKYDGVRIRTNDGDANPINEVSLTDKGLNNGGNRITNVSKGIDGTDAVNVNQLNNAIRNINGTNNQLANTVRANQQEARKGIAGTAALAGLHPLDFDPDHKLDIMAGYGHFHNANAGAIGVAYRPNEDLMFTAGTTFGSDNVINAGVTYKVGARSEVSRSKVAMAKDLAESKKEIAQLQADNAKFKAILNAVLGLDLPQEANTVFPDIEENHWAYVAVEDMVKRGLLVGYPDGTFKGDRAVTRYEFAEVIHRAIEKAKELGQTVDSRLVEEFKPELMRYAVEGKKLERVHVNKSTKEIKRDQYGTIITK